jgi:hypothetical protein
MSKSKKGKGNEKIKAVLGILGFLFLYAIIEAYILFMIMVSLCWLIKDWADFIMFMRGG